MAAPTSFLSSFRLNALKSLIVTKIKFVNIKIFPPSTAILFGVKPHSEILNKIADKAIPFTIILTIDTSKSMKVYTKFFVGLAVPATEKNIIAITPINRMLKVKRNSL